MIFIREILCLCLVMVHEPAVLIEGVLFRARYLGSTQLVCEGQPTKSTRMMQAEEAVSRIKVKFKVTCMNDPSCVNGSVDLCLQLDFYFINHLCYQVCKKQSTSLFCIFRVCSIFTEGKYSK